MWRKGESRTKHILTIIGTLIIGVLVWWFSMLSSTSVLTNTPWVQKTKVQYFHCLRLVAGMLTINGQNLWPFCWTFCILLNNIVRDLVIPGETVTMASSRRPLLSFKMMNTFMSSKAPLCYGSRPLWSMCISTRGVTIHKSNKKTFR